MNLKEIKGVGDVTLQKLDKLGISDVKTLLYHFPSRYIDRSKQLKVIDLKLVEGTSYHVIGYIKNIRKIRLRGGREMTTAVIYDDTGSINAMWFNNPYINSQYENEEQILISGDINKNKIVNPKIKKYIDEVSLYEFARIEPIYPETKGLRSYQINNFIRICLERWNELRIKESLPQKILKSEKFLSLEKALYYIHFPENLEQIEKSRKRLGFEEMYKILLEVKKRKKHIIHFPSHQVRINETTHDIFLQQLGFTLTDSQQEAISEIYADIQKKHPMHRLLNGDVGAGKTAVAAAAVWQVINNNYQAVILAPTSVLAEQHYRTFKKLFEGIGAEIILATASTRKEYEKLLSSKANDKTNQIIIGTHALFHRLELFKKVGIVIIDEQHKFGVEQRDLLAHYTSNKDDNVAIPHVLSMSATPIPRSLALTLFGDIEVSFLKTKPMGRKEIITRNLTGSETVERMYAWIHQEIIKAKAQVYIVCPLIAESEALDIKSAQQEYETLSLRYPDIPIGLLHGKLKAVEKENVLADFHNGDISILVTTSVIEVGIDNPNATIMVIEGAERFGLAQLHQLRGRVGRSDRQSYCFLKTTGDGVSPRLTYFASHTDGFKIAEFDLQTRGPGEVYGNQQSGIPQLKIATILDLDLIKRVKAYLT